MSDLKNVNVKFSIVNIERVKQQAKHNKRTFQAELELILDEYFQTKSESSNMEKTQ